MKKIVIIDGGPRRNMNTAGMLQAFAESFSEEAMRKWRDEHWAEDLQKAFDAGKKMVERILG